MLCAMNVYLNIIIIVGEIHEKTNMLYVDKLSIPYIMQVFFILFQNIYLI